jgi:D-glycero-D-manno-heptose 1,7-bisphosphate phosphatase
MVLLAGGMGTRLGARSASVPKPLQPVDGRPFLRHLIEDARRYGVTHFLLLAGHLGALVAETFAADSDVEVLIEPAPLGTGGALRFARERLAQTFFMANGDSFFRFNLLDLAAPLSRDCIGRLALRRVSDADRYGVVDLDGARVRGFRERGEGGAGLINGGVYLLQRAIVDAVGEGPVSIERDVFPRLAAAGRLAGAVYDGPFIDIGVPDSLDAAQSFVPEMRRADALVMPAALAVAAPDAVKRANDVGLYVLLEDGDAASVNAALHPHGAHIDDARVAPWIAQRHGARTRAAIEALMR